VGTRGFMAPEQESGDPDLDTPADVYALGRVLQEVVRATAMPAPPELDALVREALAFEPRLRPTARELAERVPRSLDGDRDHERRRALAADALAEAHRALAADDRALAMSSAGRALALDPESAEAAGIVTSLMVEAPRELPGDLEAALAEDD